MPIFNGGLNRANATIEAMNAEAARQDLAQAKKITTEQYNNAVKQYNKPGNCTDQKSFSY